MQASLIGVCLATRSCAKWPRWWERTSQKDSFCPGSVRCAVTAGCSTFVRYAAHHLPRTVCERSSHHLATEWLLPATAPFAMSKQKPQASLEALISTDVYIPQLDLTLNGFIPHSPGICYQRQRIYFSS